MAVLLYSFVEVVQTPRYFPGASIALCLLLLQLYRTTSTLGPASPLAAPAPPPGCAMVG